MFSVGIYAICWLFNGFIFYQWVKAGIVPFACLTLPVIDLMIWHIHVKLKRAYQPTEVFNQVYAPIYREFNVAIAEKVGVLIVSSLIFALESYSVTASQLLMGALIGELCVIYYDLIRAVIGLREV